MTAPDPWAGVVAARLSADQLAALGPVRDRADVRVFPAGGVVWVRWPSGRVEVVRCLLPVPGVRFYTPRDGAWFPFGRRVPTADAPPAGDGLPVAAGLVPARLSPVPSPDDRPGPLALGVTRGGGPRSVTAIACPVAAILPWADAATASEIEAVSAARYGGRAILRGPRLPSIPAAVRYWGDTLLVPVGFRPDPDLPPPVVRAAAGATGDDLVVLDAGGVTIIPRVAFAPLTRASVRLAARDLPAEAAP